MEFVATQKFVRMSPRKLRFVADMVRKLRPTEALEVLPQIGKRAGEPLAKVVKTAIANAKQKGISDTDLTLKEIQIGDGPRLKRGRPVSRGRWHPYKRRMSHIRVVVVTKSQVPSTKSKTKSNEQNSKSKTKKTQTRSSKLASSLRNLKKDKKSVGSISKKVKSKTGRKKNV